MKKEFTFKGNPILEPIIQEALAKGEAIGEVKGEARGMAKALGPPDEVLDAIGNWPADKLESLLQMVNEARETNDWSAIAPSNSFSIK